MKVSIDREYGITLEEVYNPITLKHPESSDKISIAERDNGFEAYYHGDIIGFKDNRLEITLETFLKYLVARNSIVRLWEKCKKGGDCGYYLVQETKMEWEILRDKSHTHRQVLGVVDILVEPGDTMEAINIALR